MSKCCKPQLNVVLTTITGTALNLTINRPLSSVGGNTSFNICIAKNQVPLTDPTTGLVLTLPVQFVDPLSSQLFTPVFQGCNGNILRSDQLARFLACNACGPCCNFNFCAVYGLDSPHVTIHNRFCPSQVSISTAATLAQSGTTITVN